MSFKKKLKNIIKKFDYFAVHLNFRYKSKDKYHTLTGGITFIIYIIFIIIFLLFNLSSFIKRKSMNIISLNMKLHETDKINLAKTNLSFAYNIRCGGNSTEKQMQELFELKLVYIDMTKEKGIETKNKIKVESDFCNNSNFYNNFNESMESIDLYSYYCPINLSYINLEGQYSDEHFRYLEFSLKAKKTSPNDFDTYYHLFSNYDCKLVIYYIDNAINVFNYYNPVEQYIDIIFLQIDPTRFLKLNTFFILQHFKSYENLLFDIGKNKIYPKYNRQEKYNLYKGLDRFKLTPDDFEYFAKIYFRADWSRDILIRKYQKLTEFIANIMSIFTSVLIFLVLILTEINRFYSNISIMKNIYSFNRENQKDKKEKYLINMKNNFSDHFKTRVRTHEFDNLNTKLTLNIKGKNNNVIINKFNNKSFLSIKNSQISNENILNINNKNNKNFLAIPIPIDNTSFICNNNSNNSNINYDNNNSINNSSIMRFKNYLSTLKFFKNSLTKNPSIKKKKTMYTTLKIKKEILINYNINEFFFYKIFPCLVSNKIKNKHKLFTKGKEKLFYQINIFTYLNNMQNLELMVHILFENYQKNIMKIINKPFIYLDDKKDFLDKIKISGYTLNNKDIQNFEESFLFLDEKKNKNYVDKKLYELAKEEIKSYLI